MLSSGPLKRFVATPFTLTHQWVSAWTQYLGSTPTPGQFFTDSANFWSAMLAQQAPEFAHANTVVAQWPIAKLRDFSTATATATAHYPTLVLPPRSGMTSAGVDVSRDASLIGTLQGAGHGQTFSLDWLPAQGETAQAGIVQHVQVVQEAIDHLGGRVHLVGYSQGGWMGAIVAALRPETVVTLTLGAAPIDCHAGLDRPAVTSYRALGKVGDLAEPLDRVQWVYPGILQAGLLRTMEWTEDTARAAAMWAGIGDPAKREQNAAIRQWLNTPEDLPGPFVRWMLEELFAQNKLVHGDLMIGTELIDLSRIECPLYLIAGERDVISPPDQLWAITDLVATPAEHIHRVLAPAGHLDLMFDSEILADYWLPLLSSSASTA